MLRSLKTSSLPRDESFDYLSGRDGIFECRGDDIYLLHILIKVICGAALMNMYITSNHDIPIWTFETDEQIWEKNSQLDFPAFSQPAKARKKLYSS